MGTSYGGYIALMLCRTRLPKSLFLRAPAVHETLPEELVSTSLQDDEFRAELRKLLPEQSILRPLSEFDGSVTLIESERDKSVRPESIQACLMVANNAHHEVIEGADHVLNDDERLVFQNLLVKWASEL